MKIALILAAACLFSAAHFGYQLYKAFFRGYLNTGRSPPRKILRHCHPTLFRRLLILNLGAFPLACVGAVFYVAKAVQLLRH
jgi:hypothetical protein